MLKGRLDNKESNEAECKNYRCILVTSTVSRSQRNTMKSLLTMNITPGAGRINTVLGHLTLTKSIVNKKRVARDMAPVQLLFVDLRQMKQPLCRL